MLGAPPRETEYDITIRGPLVKQKHVWEPGTFKLHSRFLRRPEPLAVTRTKRVVACPSLLRKGHSIHLYVYIYIYRCPVSVSLLLCIYIYIYACIYIDAPYIYIYIHSSLSLNIYICIHISLSISVSLVGAADQNSDVFVWSCCPESMKNLFGAADCHA